MSWTLIWHGRRGMPVVAVMVRGVVAVMTLSWRWRLALRLPCLHLCTLLLGGLPAVAPVATLLP